MAEEANSGDGVVVAFLLNTGFSGIFLKGEG